MKVLGFIILVTILLLTIINKNSSSIILDDINTMPTRKVYLGAWVGGFWDDSKRKLGVTSLKTFEQNIGRKVAIATIYTDWTYLENEDLLKSLNEISENGWTPMISSNPKFFEKCKKTKESLYKTIASGKCDDFIKSAANNLKKHNKPIMFRFAWEMNLPDIYWSVHSLNSTSKEFTDAWIHIYKIFEAENVKNVEWVLSFNTSSSKTIPYKELFPGDEYVDWVAIDGYNWGTSVDWSKWTNFNGVFRNSYDELSAITNKPIMLSEVNSSPEGGNKAEWLSDMLTKQIPENYPQVKALVFFNEEKLAGESVDWRMEKSEDYLKALQKTLNNEIYYSNY